MTNEYRYFFKSNFFGVNRLFVLVCSNQVENAKRFKTRRYYLPNGILGNCKVISIGKKFMKKQLILI